jgi:tetratricopeptide (TPR) repeat protein
LPPQSQQAPGRITGLPHRGPKIRPIRSIKECRYDATERRTMSKRYFAQITNCLRHRPRTRSTTALVAGAIVLATAGLAWYKLQTNRAVAIQAKFADSPTWDAARQEWPGNLPGGPEKVAAVATVSPVAMPAPAVEYGPPQAPSQVPSIAAGPEIFAAPAGPKVPAATGNVNGRGPAPAGQQMGPVPSRQPVRSEAMEMIARQADEKVREGMDLADRGAYFAARADFIAALRLLAQGLDNDEGASRHSQSLGAALTAMREAQDFLPAPGKVEGELDLAPIVAGHRTPLLKNVPPQYLQAMRAMKQYFSFAQEQLCLAVGHEIAGSMALRSLGKLHAAMAEKAIPEVVLPEAQAITFFQAAMLVCPRNYMAANDLGVLLAHKNDNAGARIALEHSVYVCPCAENLRNLSIVFRQLGDLRAAELAGRDADAARAAELARQRSHNRFAGGAVQWVDPSAMPKPTGQWSDSPVRPSAAATTPPGAAMAGPAPGQPTGSPVLR